jgi:hypothetical protein
MKELREEIDDFRTQLSKAQHSIADAMLCCALLCRCKALPSYALPLPCFAEPCAALPCRCLALLSIAVASQGLARLCQALPLRRVALLC